MNALEGAIIRGRMLIGATKGPDQNFQQLGEMKYRRKIRQNDASGIRHRIAREFGLRVLQWPREMVNLTAVDALVMNRVQAIAGREEIFQRSLVADPRRPYGTVGATQFRRWFTPR